MTQRILITLMIGAVVLCGAACDDFWQPICLNPMAPGCTVEMALGSSQLWCGEAAQLELRVKSGNPSSWVDVSAQLNELAPSMSVTLKIDDSFTQTLATPTYQDGVLRVAIDKAELPQRPAGNGKIMLNFAKTSLTAPISYICKQRQFVAAAVQQLSSTGTLGAPIKYGGIGPHPIDSQRQALALVSYYPSSNPRGQYWLYGILQGEWKQVSETTVIYDIDINKVDIFRLTKNGFVFDINGRVSAKSMNIFGLAAQDKFGRRLLAARGTSNLVATVGSSQFQLLADPSTGLGPFVATNFPSDIHALAIGETAPDLQDGLVIATRDQGKAYVFQLLPRAPTEVEIQGTENPELEQILSAQLAPLESSSSFTISSVALADFDHDGLIDLLALKRSTKVGVPSEIGIIYGMAKANFASWRPISIQENKASAYNSILSQEIDSVDVGSFDGDAYPDLVIATKSEVRVYLNAAL